MSALELLDVEVADDAFVAAVRDAKSLEITGCDVIANMSLCSERNIHLSDLLFSESNLRFPPHFRFAPFVLRLEISQCGLNAFSLSLESVQSLVLSGNMIRTLDLTCPSLFLLDVSENELTDLEFLRGLPNLRTLKMRNNRLSALRFPSFYPLVELDVRGNQLSIAEFRHLIPLRELTDLSFSPPDVESVSQARNLVLGEFMSRADEVSNVVGRNIFEERFTASLAFEKEAFEARRKLAQQCIIEPIDSGMAVISLMLPQVVRLNGETLDSKEVLRFKEWICPDPSILSIGSGIWYE